MHSFSDFCEDQRGFLRGAFTSLLTVLFVCCVPMEALRSAPRIRMFSFGIMLSIVETYWLKFDASMLGDS